MMAAVSLLSLPEHSATQIYRWPGPLVYPLLIVGFGTALAWCGWKLPAPRLPCRTVLAGMAVVFVGGAASLWANATVFSGFLGLVQLAIFLMGILLLVPILQSRANRDFAGLAMGVAGGVVTCFSLWGWAMQDVPMELGLLDPLNQMTGEPLLSFQLADHRNARPFGHQNYTAGFLLLVLPWHVWLALRSGARAKLLWGAVALLDVVCLVSTYSRGAWLGLGAAAVWLVVWLKVDRRLTGRRLMILTVGMFVLGITLLLANPRLSDSLMRLVSRGSTQIDQVRANMAEAGWTLFRENWLLGVGPGNVSAAYPRIRGQLDYGLEDVYQLHVTPLQIVAEQGVIGLIGWTLLLTGLIGSLWQNRPLRGAGVAAVAALVGYGTFSMTDYQLDVLPIALVLAINLAIALSGNDRRIVLNGAGSQWFGVAGLVLATTMVLLLIPELRGRRLFNEAMLELKSGDPAGYLEKASRAVTVSPRTVYFPNQLAAFYMDRWGAETNSSDRLEASRAALRWLDHSLSINPDQEFCWFNRGWILLEIEPADAAASFVRAARLVPDRKGVFQGLGFALLQLGSTNAAVRSLAIECMVQPRFLISGIWDQPELRLLLPAVKVQLIVFLKEHLERIPASDGDALLWAKQRLALMHWWNSGDLTVVDQLEWSGAAEQFWETIRTADQKELRATDPPAPWKHFHDAWLIADQRERLVQQAMILSEKRVPDEAVQSRLVDWLNQTNWADVVLRTPPDELFSASGRQRSGFNLLSRNMDGIKPTDLCVYIDNHVVALFFEFLLPDRSVPSSWVLEDLEAIIQQAPLLKAALRNQTP